MRSQRSNSGWIVAVLLWAILTFVVGTLPPVLADEQRTFCGRTLEGSVEALRHGSASDPPHAVWMLSFFGSAASKAVPDLIDRLRQAGNVRREIDALTALGRIGPAAAPAVPLLIAGYLAEGATSRRRGTSAVATADCQGWHSSESAPGSTGADRGADRAEQGDAGLCGDAPR